MTTTIFTVSIFDVETGNKLVDLSYSFAVRDAVFSPDGSLLAIACGDNSARVIDVMTRKERFKFNHKRPVASVAFAPNGRMIATASSDKSVKLLDIEAGAEVRLLHHDDRVLSVAFSSDGKLLATTSGYETQQVFEVSTGIILFKIANERSVSGPSLSPNGQLRVAVSGDNLTTLFDAANGDQISQFYLPNAIPESVFENAWFSPSGLTVVTSSSDKIARVWRVYPTAQTLVDAAKENVGHCLTQAQRKEYFLPVAPPFWCVQRRLQPYHGDIWQAWLLKQKAWLSSGLRGDAPALPKAE